MSMELWVAVILMFGGPDKSSPMIHTMSGPPVETVELCERDAKSQGLKIYYRIKAPAGWKLMGVFCAPLLEDYRIDLKNEGV
tara:strand:- start:2328 stop:2573 length:246 start_codon:yes stop_codon:yes gene_type:complete